jgi:hypothetical protein
MRGGKRARREAWVNEKIDAGFRGYRYRTSNGWEELVGEEFSFPFGAAVLCLWLIARSSALRRAGVLPTSG